METHTVKGGSIQRRWVHFDAEGQVLGRLATRVAAVLRGKDKPDFTPHLDLGDFVVITNASKIAISGRKVEQRKFAKYSGYQGGLKVVTLRDLVEHEPEEVVTRAVRGMMPHTKLGRAQMKKLRVYAGAEHPHIAQQPVSRS